MLGDEIQGCFVDPIIFVVLDVLIGNGELACPQSVESCRYLSRYTMAHCSNSKVLDIGQPKERALGEDQKAEEVSDPQKGLFLKSMDCLINPATKVVRADIKR
jgi:hypothetical protein